MILGLNNNIPYRGHVFHVQTEDSGVKMPHIITHLFYGGNIISTQKVDYSDIVKVEKLEGIVRDLMKEQHQKMINNLQNGVFDDRISAFVQAEKKGGPPPKAESTERRISGESLANKSLDEMILDFLSKGTEGK